MLQPILKLLRKLLTLTDDQVNIFYETYHNYDLAQMQAIIDHELAPG